MKLCKIVLFLCSFASLVFSENSIDLRGTVTDQNGNPVAGATVVLVQGGSAAVTNALGEYEITGAVPVITTTKGAVKQFTIKNNCVIFNLKKSVKADIGLYNLQGRKVHTVHYGSLSAGKHVIPLSSNSLPSQVYLLRVKIGSATTVTKWVNFSSNQTQGSAVYVPENGIVTAGAFSDAVDTLVVTAAGYADAKQPLASYRGNVNIVLEQAAARGYELTSKEKSIIDDLISAHMSSCGNVGMSVAIAKAGNVVYAKGAGNTVEPTPYYNGYNHPVKSIDNTTLFRVASVSKSITAVAIMKLLQDGKFSNGLQTRIFGNGSIFENKYKPQYADYPEDLKRITLEHLLEQSTGTWSGDPILLGAGHDNIPPYKYSFLSADNAQNMSHYDFMKFVVEELTKSANSSNGLFSKTATGSAYQYLNFNYYVLGRVIEEVTTGMTYEMYVREHILQPLGITHMYIGSQDWRGLRTSPYETNYAGLHPFHQNMKHMDACGGWIANASDLAKFASSVRGKVLDDYHWNLLFTRGTISAGAGGYKKGWRIQSYNPDIRTLHATLHAAGNMPGSTANIFMQDDIAIAAIANGYAPPADAFTIISDIFENIALHNDVPLTGDIDGDGKNEMIIFRPSNPEATWFVKEKNGSSYQTLLRDYKFGFWNDKPMVANVNMAGGDELIICRSDRGLLKWWAKNALDNTWFWIERQWGLDGDKPMVGNLDNDGNAEMIVFRPSNRMWYAKEGSGSQVLNGFVYGKAWDVPMVADVDPVNNNGDEIIIFKKWGGARWFARNINLNSNIWYNLQWGLEGDVPLVGDLNNNDLAEMIVWRPSTGTWHAKEKNAVDPVQDGYVYGRDPIDVPMVGNTDGLYGDDIIIWKPSLRKWYSKTGVQLNTYWNGYSWGLPWR